MRKVETLEKMARDKKGTRTKNHGRRQTESLSTYPTQFLRFPPHVWHGNELWKAFRCEGKVVFLMGDVSIQRKASGVAKEAHTCGFLPLHSTQALKSPRKWKESTPPPPFSYKLKLSLHSSLIFG